MAVALIHQFIQMSCITPIHSTVASEVTNSNFLSSTFPFLARLSRYSMVLYPLSPRTMPTSRENNLVLVHNKGLIT